MSGSQQRPLEAGESNELQPKTTVKDILNRMPVYSGILDDRKPIYEPRFFD